MTLPRDPPRRLVLDLTTLELSMLCQALMLMAPQIERSVNAATGEEVFTADLILKLVNAGITANAAAAGASAAAGALAAEEPR